MPYSEPKTTPRRIEWRSFYEEFQNRSDRASAIVGAAFLDGHLGHLIASFLVDDAEQVAALLDPDRPLGSFGAKIRAAYCMGLISPDEQHDLNLILHVQNTFAAEMSGISFEDERVRAYCQQLLFPGRVQLPGEQRSSRSAFVFATALLAQTLSLRALEAEARRRTVPREYEFVPSGR